MIHNIKNRITEEYITTLKPNEIFVFGSNLSGIHGAGAAKCAYSSFGAQMGNPTGIQGQSYAIPTKGIGAAYSLKLNEIKDYVDLFIKDAIETPHLTYLVTEIGCNLANFTPAQIAPLFKEAINIDNIHLPFRFWLYLNMLDDIIYKRKDIKIPELDMMVYHDKIYNGTELMKISGIKKRSSPSKEPIYEIELEGDYSGGTHIICQRSFLPLEGAHVYKQVCTQQLLGAPNGCQLHNLHCNFPDCEKVKIPIDRSKVIIVPPKKYKLY